MHFKEAKAMYSSVIKRYSYLRTLEEYRKHSHAACVFCFKFRFPSRYMMA